MAHLETRSFLGGFVLLLALIAGVVWPLRPAAASSALKMALVLPGPTDDRGWSQSGYEGLRLVERKLGAQVAFRANVPAAGAKELFRRYAREGFDFIVGHGGEYLPAAEAVALEFPKAKFAVVGRFAGNNRNLGALSFRTSETGYLAGVVAALKTQTMKIAHLGGETLAMSREAASAFERGARATRPGVQVSVAWVGSWTDSAKAAKLARALVKSGADVLSVDADIGGIGALKAAEEGGAFVIAWSLERPELAPRRTLANVIQRVPALLLEGATLVQQRRWEGKQYKFGLREGAQDVAPIKGMLSLREEGRFNSLKNDLRFGKLDITESSLLQPEREGP